MSRFEVVRLEELDRIPVAEGLEWRPIRRRFDIRAFGVNAYTAEGVGGHVVEEHDESRLGHEELYLVVDGRARFTLDGEEIDAPAGTLVYLRDPTVRRSALAEEEGTTVLAVGGKPGAAFEPSAWEWSFEAGGHARRGDVDRALEVMREGHAGRPDNASMLYNLACYEALAGLRAEALEHLREAIARDASLAEYARGDEDFDSIRVEVSAIAGEPEAGGSGA